MLTRQREIVDREQVLEISDCGGPLAVRYEMNLVGFAPTLGQALGEPVDFTDFLVDLAQIPWLIECLMGSMLSVEVVLAVDRPGQAGSIVLQTSIRLKVDDAHDLLVELAGTVV